MCPAYARQHGNGIAGERGAAPVASTSAARHSLPQQQQRKRRNLKKSMSEQSSPLAVSHNRLRALVVPREHGAWGMLLVPLASGATVGLIRGGQSLRLGFFTAAALAVFWLRTPLESWLGTSPLRAQTAVERRLVLCYALLLSTFAAFMFAGLFWDGRSRDLLPLGAIAAFAFARDL